MGLFRIKGYLDGLSANKTHKCVSKVVRNLKLPAMKTTETMIGCENVQETGGPGGWARHRVHVELF